MNKLDTPFQQFIALSKYARWDDELGRRETWEETVDRYIDFMEDYCGIHTIDEKIIEELREAIVNLEIMPSMRALMTAGEALARDNVAGFNCSYVSVDNLRAFDEALYILTCGTGLGFSVERQFINKLPEVGFNPELRGHYDKSQFYNVAEKELSSFDADTNTIIVADSKYGWASALRILLVELYNSNFKIKWDVSNVRPAGERLKVFGGRASGPGPLVQLFNFCKQVFQKAAGRRLNSIECHDIMCMIGDIVVVGGVRRCLPGSSPVPTREGVKKIQDIVPGDYVVTGGKEYKVLEQVYSGKQKLLNITHRFGSIRCTENHRVAVFDSANSYTFKAAKDIKVGDVLVWDSVGYEGEDGLLPALTEKPHFNAKQVQVPARINTELAWLFGLVHGDGHIADRSIEITAATHESALLEAANGVFFDHFGISGKVSQGKGDCVRLRVNSAALCRWFKQHIKVANEPVRIPNFIMNASKQVRFAYLAGVFDSDGRTRKDGVLEQCTTIYREFNEDLTTLLAGLGIGCSTYFGSAQARRDAGVNAKDFYSLKISGNTNRKTWHSGIKNFSISGKLPENVSGKSPYDFSLPNSMLEIPGYKLNGNVLLSSGNFEADTYYPTEVVEIFEEAPEDTFDIQVEEVEQFTTSGVVVHNSALISLSNLSDPRLRDAKHGNWWEENPQRALANNSACYTEMPDMNIFMQEWHALYDSKSGERGIFSRVAAQKKVAENGRRDPSYDFGTNPCCVAGDTLILTSEGPKKIEDLEGKPFTAIVDGKEHHAPRGSWIAGVAKPLELVLEDGKRVVATKDHRILTVNGPNDTLCWVEMQNLVPGHHRVRLNGGGSSLVQELAQLEEEITVWDAEVSDVHAFGANGIYVHNSEIILRPNEFCNLTEVVVRHDDNYASLSRKVKLATILGTFQSMLTDFVYLRPEWKENCDEERLLGVSLTGIMDNTVMSGRTSPMTAGFGGGSTLETILQNLRGVSISTNRDWAEYLEIPQSAAISCVKPSGTVSQLVGSASGIHPRHSRTYLRRARADNKDPLTQFMLDVGFDAEPDVMKPNETTVFTFPQCAPDGAITRHDLSAIEHLEIWLTYAKHWCEHKPSITVSVREHEWLEVGAFVFKHFEHMSGVSFLPFSEHTYQQAPYEDCDLDDFIAHSNKQPVDVDWSKLKLYEGEDHTTSSQELACVGGSCDIV